MIRSPEDINPLTLTILLREVGLLPHGEVKKVECLPAAGTPFGLGHPLFNLTMEYAGIGSALLPERLFLKFGSSRKESFFYTDIAPDMNQSLLLHRFYTSYDPQTDRTCLLLEHISATHYQTEWPLPPPESLCIQTVERLAEIHAGWWTHPRLETDFRTVLPKGRSWADRNSLAMDKLPGFLDFLGDRLSSSRRHVFGQILSSYYSSRPLWDIQPNDPNVTLVHGDMHFWNVFFPKTPGADNLRFIDWNMWDIGHPTDDLAYLLALHWFPERRSQMEQHLLECYLNCLGKCGITSYTQDKLWNDYRISVIRSLLIPVWQWVRGVQPVIWWGHLERGMQAFEDLNCKEMWQ